MIELLRAPVVIPGKVPSMANIHLNWRMLKVPLERIKNPGTRSARKAYDYAMSWRDSAVALLREQAKGQAPAGVSVFIYIQLAFKPVKPKAAKGKLAPAAPNPADLVQDVDNPSKAILDAIQKAGLVVNDKQVITLVMDKACAAAETQATIRSIAVGRPPDKYRWLQRVAAMAEG